MRARAAAFPARAELRRREVHGIQGSETRRVDEIGRATRGNDAVAALAGEAEDFDRGGVQVARERLAQQRRAHGRAGCGRSPAGWTRHAAVSSTVMSSTSRMTNTVRKATGSSSIRRSRMRRTSRAQGRVSRRLGLSSSATSGTSGRVPSGLAAERDDDAVALLAPQPHQRLIDDDAREPGGELRLAAEVADAPIGRRGTPSCRASSASASSLRIARATRNNLPLCRRIERLEGCLIPTPMMRSTRSASRAGTASRRNGTARACGP